MPSISLKLQAINTALTGDWNGAIALNEQILKDDPNLFSKRKHRSVEALGKLVELLIESKHYIQDVNRQNLVFDGKKWHVIDSSVIHAKTNRSDTRHKYKKAFLKSWSKSLNSKKEIHALKPFIGKYCH